MADQAKGKGIAPKRASNPANSGPAIDNISTSNLDPPIDIGSKEGFKDTITSSIVKELSKKAYTIPDDTVLLMLLRNSLSSSPRAVISWIYIPSKAFKLLVRQYSRPIESKKEDIVVEIPSHSIRKEYYRPIIEDAIVSEAIEPKKRYKLRNSPAKGTTLEGTEITDLLTTWLAKRGIKLSTSAPYIYEQNRLYLNSTKDYKICLSCNGNTVANLGPKLSSSSNTTIKLSRDFYSKEGPRPLTTTSTTIVDSRNGKGSSRTSIINSSLVPMGFSDSDFAGDKATNKSTYGYLYKLASGPISWKTKRATTIALSTLEAETDGLTEAIREVQQEDKRYVYNKAIVSLIRGD
ncbi:hypothetical protein P8C59_009564 [Phyllachora maydis]|uniref:Reverse transcriptase n=1 Tax=Phyllachora maydis TaxID=1825666 RepID=A0AAD9MLF8_9PEZI|nr:hypothetical protein P8C59_009564 [Phyllachora maydis]